LIGELEAWSADSEESSEPEPSMMAPLRLPSIDSELPSAMRICGCAGTAMVNGTWAIDIGVGAVAERPELAASPVAINAREVVAARRIEMFMVSPDAMS
jgi:hypothetical protein